MKIAIIGLGPIGSTFAFHLARAGHEVTVVARNARLAQLEQERAIVTTADERAPVTVSAALDTSTAWDLVLVTVLDSQVDALLPVLRESAAKQVMFMFNTFSPLDRLRDAVGAHRFVFGFPAILAEFKEGKLKSHVVRRGMITPVTDPAWAETFSKAGIPAEARTDMPSWLRTHAALVVPLMLTAYQAHSRGRGLSWDESRALAAGLTEGFELVRSLGHPLSPPGVAALALLPAPALTLAVWLFSRNPTVDTMGAQGLREARALLEDMIAAAPARTPRLQSLRP